MVRNESSALGGVSSSSMGGDKSCVIDAEESSIVVEQYEEENVVIDLAAKKKKKKKGKTKEETQEGSKKSNGKGKKVKVEEIQEILARRKEAEEKKIKEEEERLRKEEEERLLQEEKEREAEEKRIRKKLKEKEKLQKKKEEGRILTEKQKRDQAFKKKLLTDAGGSSLLVGDKTGESSKRPVYGNKRKLARGQAKDSASVQVEDHVVMNSDIDERINRQEPSETEEIQGAVGLAQENSYEVHENDGWDAKSLDSLDLNIKTDFDEEEERQPVIEKGLKDTDRPPVNFGIAGKPTTTKKVIPKVVNDTEPEDASKADRDVVPNEVVKEREYNLRSPICCIMGHVDTGKTKLLDCIRGTNVQEGEAGGITQQIGATYIPAENIREKTKELKADAIIKVPGLLVIDTPGHESFTNLRSRGSNLCDFAILVVDIMHGLEPQTIESLNLIRSRETMFIIALNKVDKLYGWKTSKNTPMKKAIKQQSKDVGSEFKMRLTGIVTQFKEQGLNTELYYNNRDIDMKETISIVPTSAISGEGIPELLLSLVRSQSIMAQKLTFVDQVQCTVLEVKVIEGHGTTIDVVLVNGVLNEGDQIVVCGSQGPIVTTIRSLLTPHPMKELRVKDTYLHHRKVKAAQCIKITAQGLEHAVAGTSLHVIGPDDDVEEAKKTALEDMESVMSRIDKSGEGVYVQASTLGSLEALLEFLKSPDVRIPVSGIGIGPVHKKDIMKAGVMLEKKKEFATVLAFDVKVNSEARELADKTGVRILCADIIYHLFDQFNAYMRDIKEEKKRETADEVVFPCVLEIVNVFRNCNPIFVQVKIIDGILKVGTPICVMKMIENKRTFMDIGRVASMMNSKKAEVGKKGEEVTIKIVPSNPGEKKTCGKHFSETDKLVSHISRRSVDVLEANYMDELSDDESRLVLTLKRIFKIL